MANGYNTFVELSLYGEENVVTKIMGNGKYILHIVKVCIDRLLDFSSADVFSFA